MGCLVLSDVNEKPESGVLPSVCRMHIALYSDMPPLVHLRLHGDQFKFIEKEIIMTRNLCSLYGAVWDRLPKPPLSFSSHS